MGDTHPETSQATFEGRKKQDYPLFINRDAYYCPSLYLYMDERGLSTNEGRSTVP